jgi:hypothetical protein
MGDFCLLPSLSARGHRRGFGLTISKYPPPIEYPGKLFHHILTILTPLSSLYTHLLKNRRIDEQLVVRLGPGPDPPNLVNAKAFFTPSNHLPANVIGAELVKHLGLVVEGDKWHWKREWKYW